MIKLKHLIKESLTWDNRKFGERLPTLKDYQEAHDKKLKEGLLTEATRSVIGLELPNGKITAVYCHYDGYPEGVGTYLKKYYKSPAVIKKLIQLGKHGISTLGKNIGKKHDFNMPYEEKEKLGYTTFYGRDRGEKQNMSFTYKDRQDYEDNFDGRSGAEFGYVFSMKDKKWYYYSDRGNQGIL